MRAPRLPLTISCCRNRILKGVSRVKFVVLLVLGILFGSAAFAAERGAASQVMVDYTQAMRAWDVEGMVARTHPDALRRIRTVFDGVFTSAQSEQARADLLPMFGVDSYEEFVVLTDIEMYQRMLEGTARGAPGLTELMASSQVELLGEVEDGGDVLVNYVLSIGVQGGAVEQEVVQRPRRQGEAWLLMLPANSEASIMNIEARYGAAPAGATGASK